MSHQIIIRNGLLLLCFIILIVLFIIKTQNKKLNWSLFFSLLWCVFSLVTINYICVEIGFWTFTSKTNLIIKIPFDLLFVWVIFWGIIPFYFFKGKHTIILTLLLFWLDIILMPELEKLDIIQLNSNWYIGESLLICIVWLPSYLWAQFYFNKTHLKLRSLFQVITMFTLIAFIIPFITITHTGNQFLLPKFNPYIFQIILIITFPSLCAVNELTFKGKGTPFPYDKTNHLVQTGVYAYCKNPIQWSFTLLFIPLSILYETPLLLTGTIISVAYTLGVSNPQEYDDMADRFGNEWIKYKNKVPNWLFLWRPIYIPKGTIYFKKKCQQCEQIKEWLNNRNAINLETTYSSNYKQNTFLQVTYIYHNGIEFKSIEAIAYAFEHINLAYACLGWLMRFPLIKNILQLIIDTMTFNKDSETCDLNN